MLALVLVVVAVLAGLAGLAVLVAGLARRATVLRAQLATAQQRMAALDRTLGALRTRAAPTE